MTRVSNVKTSNYINRVYMKHTINYKNTEISLLEFCDLIQLGMIHKDVTELIWNRRTL